MSTFKGIVQEFPDIRIDYFRINNNDASAPRPLAFFLSHIHSDHLQGLEFSTAGPFIYCSEATKELLIRLERRVHRLNLQQKLVERHSYTYERLKSRLRPLPLETPTEIELSLGRFLTVTLFDANHCPGAVMFLIENDENSILYTGDIRAEQWWVDSLRRNPILIPYTMGIKRLSRIYLDTTFSSGEKIYEKFPSKADGISELIQKISQYPEETYFHFHAWTFGYEDVWTAIAIAFNTKIHIDDYQYRLYSRFRDGRGYNQGAYFVGYKFGNADIEGRLTRDKDVRFHSCDWKLKCSGIRGRRVVHIKPIITREGGVNIEEIGAGHGDLESHDELALDGNNLAGLLTLFGSDVSQEIINLLKTAGRSRGQTLAIQLGDQEQVALSRVKRALTAKLKTEVQRSISKSLADPEWVEGDYEIRDDKGNLLPRQITFPYSRHSSYSELCALVNLFKPLDLYPCVYDPAKWSKQRSVRSLFGKYLSGVTYGYDEEMLRLYTSEDVTIDTSLIHISDDDLMETQRNSSVEREDNNQQLPTSIVPEGVRRKRKMTATVSERALGGKEKWHKVPAALHHRQRTDASVHSLAGERGHDLRNPWLQEPTSRKVRRRLPLKPSSKSPSSSAHGIPSRSPTRTTFLNTTRTSITISPTCDKDQVSLDLNDDVIMCTSALPISSHEESITDISRAIEQYRELATRDTRLPNPNEFEMELHKRETKAFKTNIAKNLTDNAHDERRKNNHIPNKAVLEKIDATPLILGAPMQGQSAREINRDLNTQASSEDTQKRRFRSISAWQKDLPSYDFESVQPCNSQRSDDSNSIRPNSQLSDGADWDIVNAAMASATDGWGRCVKLKSTVISTRVAVGDERLPSPEL